MGCNVGYSPARPIEISPIEIGCNNIQARYTPFRYSSQPGSPLSWGYQPRRGGTWSSPPPRTRLSFPAYLQETGKLIKFARTVPYGSSPLEGDAIY